MMRVEGDPVAQMAQRIVPEERPAEEQREGREQHPRQPTQRRDPCVSRQEQRVDEQHRRQEPCVVLHCERDAVGRGEAGTGSAQPCDADAGPHRADGNVEAGEVPVEERPLRAPEEERRQNSGCARSLRRQQAEPIGKQSGEDELEPRLRRPRGKVQECGVWRIHSRVVGENQHRDGRLSNAHGDTTPRMSLVTSVSQIRVTSSHRKATRLPSAVKYADVGRLMSSW